MSVTATPADDEQSALLPDDAGWWAPTRELLTLALPTIAQMVSYTAMQFTDTWMLASLGVREPTAAGNAGIFAFSIIGFGFGVLMCVNTLVSQNFGQKDYRACGQYLWQGVWFGVLFGLLVLPLVPVASNIFHFFGHEPELVPLEVDYFRITLTFTALKLASTAFSQFLLAINRPWIVMFAAMAGVIGNIGFNWVFIFGHWGFPRMGVAGAAWGTNVAVTVELLILTIVALSPRIRNTFNSLDWRFRWKETKTLMLIGVHSGWQIVADVLAWGLFVIWVMAQFGTAAMAASNFMFRFLSVSFMPAFGMSVAVTALVGRYIGAGRPHVAARRAHLAFFWTLIYMLSCGAIYIVWRNQLIHIFTTDADVLRIGAILMIFAGLYQLCDAMFIIYNGALRGAGDTLVPAIATAGLCWSMTVFTGYFVATRFSHFGPTGPWIVATIYGLVIGGFIFARFARGKWKEIKLEDDAPSLKVRGFDVVPATNE
jgi:MATE family multidrug resistance protein